MPFVEKYDSPPSALARPAPGDSLRSALRAAFWTLTVLALPACVANTAAWFTSTPAILAQISPFRIQALALLAAHVAFCLLLRRFRWAALFAAFAFFNAGVLLHATRAFATAPSPGPAAASSAPLKVLYSNVLTSNQDPSALLGLIASEKPDLLAFLEIDARWERQLTAALSGDYPHRFIHAREDNFGLAVLSRSRFATDPVAYYATLDIPSLDLRVSHPGGDIRVLVTHPLPPGTTTTARLRDSHIARLADWTRLAFASSSRSVLLLGDFNATPWCPPLRRLLADTGLRAAASDSGVLGTTWPAPVPFLRIPIDHALLGENLACRSYHVGPDIGSDHFPIILEIASTAPAR